MDKLTKFTGGNWVACMNDQSCWVDNGDNGLIADLEMTDIECPDELYANVSLISAAPEMYEEIQIEIEELQEFISTLNHMSGDWLYYSSRLDCKEALLAKARGES
jgi:hypothetical protein